MSGSHIVTFGQSNVCDNCTKLDDYLARLAELGAENQKLKNQNWKQRPKNAKERSPTWKPTTNAERTCWKITRTVSPTSNNF